MIHDLKPYPAYKDSGVPWLGEVPEHWSIKRLKRVAKFNPSKSESASFLTSNVDATFLPMERVGVEGGIDAKESKPASDLFNGGFTYFRRGDVLIAKITPCFENGKGACLEALPTEIGFGSTEFIVSRPMPSVLPKFLYRITTLSEFRNLGADAMTGAAGQKRVPTTFVGNFQAAIPSLSEQQRIVRYLDHIDRRIRHYICAKKKLIKLLEEQKQAIIHQAVTRGLDPNVKLKPSGAEWLGDIPEHWDIVSLGAVSELIQTGPFGSQLHSYEYIEGGVPVINPSHMQNGNIVPDVSISISQSKADSLQRHKLQPGDVIAARRGELGRCALVTTIEEGWICGTGSLRICCKKSVFCPEYFLQLFSSQGIRDSLSTSSIGATMDNLNSGMVSRLRLPLPFLDEQHHIVELINLENKKNDLAISAVKQEISLLREYRTRLIADIVTGKLDVREAATSLPEEVECIDSHDLDENFFDYEVLDEELSGGEISED